VAVKRRSNKAALTGALRTGVAACALALALATPVLAQSAFANPQGIPDTAKLLLAADQLTYDNDAGLVVATGGVQIDYGDYNLVADRVEYDQKTGRMRAIGRVEMLEPGGNRIFAENLDVTDDFADGFVNALRIETPDNTRIAAESAERVGGVETTFNNGVYTACEPCKENPGRAPLWQIKARKVIQNGRTETIRLERATFELFGFPIAYLPYLEIPDHNAKRKSGFLFPSIGYNSELGASLTVPYYLVISPHMDATISGTGYTRQGFLLEAEFRQQFANGRHVLRMAGISQASPDAFDINTTDRLERERGMIATKGDFQINPRWTFGWDIMVQSDPNFARTYGIEDYSGLRPTSQIYLTGLANRSFFDLRGYKFDFQRNDLTATGESIADQQEDRQAFVHPVLDYDKIFAQPVAGGQLRLDLNAYSLSRNLESFISVPGVGNDRYSGLEGSSSRLSAELEWKRTFTLDNGLLLTPILAARGDGISRDVTAPADYANAFAANGSDARGMVTAGLEASYPILATTATSTHVIEPIAHIFVRPDERLAGGLPNEDAQSFVFDATSLFERDKFSGFDRIEGGTRANLGIRYTGSYSSGMTTHASFGQSYHLAGLNSFTTGDLVGAGLDSGLETDVSDFVGMVGLSTPVGFSLSAAGRFDEKNFDLRRGDLSAGFANGVISTTLTYSDISAQTGYGSSVDRREIKGTASLKFAEYWTAFGGTSYDLVGDEFNRSLVGLTYEDECFVFTLTYEREKDTPTAARDWSVGARLSFRTLGDLEFGSGTLDSY